MKAKPLRLMTDSRGYEPCSATEATHIRIAMPGPITNRILPVTMGSRTATPQWLWNGDTEKPTLQPSILTRDSEHVCHSFVINGVAEFCSDCTHEMRGQSVELLDVD